MCTEWATGITCTYNGVGEDDSLKPWKLLRCIISYWLETPFHHLTVYNLLINLFCCYLMSSLLYEPTVSHDSYLSYRYKMAQSTGYGEAWYENEHREVPAKMIGIPREVAKTTTIAPGCTFSRMGYEGSSIGVTDYGLLAKHGSVNKYSWTCGRLWNRRCSDIVSCVICTPGWEYCSNVCAQHAV